MTLLSTVEVLDSWKLICYFLVYCCEAALIESVYALQKIKVGVSPGPSGTFPVLRDALSLACGAPDLCLQQRHAAHQLLQLAAGSQRPVWLPALVLVHTAVSRAHLKRPVHLTGHTHSSSSHLRPLRLFIKLIHVWTWTINLRHEWLERHVFAGNQVWRHYRLITEYF